MWRQRLFVGLAIGISLPAVGCGGSTTDDPMAILLEFQNDANAASQKYKGKTVRLRVEKISLKTKAGPSVDRVGVQGHLNKSALMLHATVTDPAEMAKASALKIGDPAIIEGEVGGVLGEKRGMGVILLKSAKVAP
jgi:hypothetical protein